MNQSVLRDFGFGFVHGALVYGASISWLHVRHNRLESPLQSLATLLLLGLIYGLCSALVVGLGAGFWAQLSSRLGRERSVVSGRWISISTRIPETHPRVVGVWLFSVLFWEGALLYGLTYQQTLLVHPQAAWGMAAYLVLAAVLIALAITVVLWGLLRVGERLAGPNKTTQKRTPQNAATKGAKLLARATAFAAVLAVGCHLGAPAYRAARAEPPRPPTMAAGDVEVADTGISVVVIGLDGLDPRVLDRLSAEGELPNFDRLRQAGASGYLATLEDANSAVIWASIYTGYPPRQHGILDFYRVRVPGTGAGLFPVHRTYFNELTSQLDRLRLAPIEIVTRHSLHTFPFWEIADRFGLTIGVVDGYLYSYPAIPPDTPGSYFVSYGVDTFARKLERGEMPASSLPLYVQPIDLFGAERLPAGPDFEWQSQTLLSLLQHGNRPRVINFYAHQPDAVQHAHWRSFEPRRYFGQATRSGATVSPIVDMHRDFDRFLGELLEVVDENTVLVVVSDHGHAATMVHKLDTQHRHGPPGALMMFGGPIRRDVGIAGASVYDIFPTLLYLLGLPLPEDVPGRVLSEALTRDFQDARPIRTIPTYQGLWLPEIPETKRDRELNQVEIDKLRDLGYL